MNADLRDNTSIITYLFLKQLTVPVTKAYLKKELLSHPDYPSLYSISATLDHYSVKNTAIKITNSDFENINLPFLAHLNIKHGLFCIVTNITDSHVTFQTDFSQTETLRKEDFFILWDNIVLIANVSDNCAEPDFKKNFIKENLNRFKLPVFIFLITLLLTLQIIYNTSISSIFPLFITKAVGLYFIYLLIRHELGKNSVLTQKLCTLSKSAGCNEVLNSKFSTLPMNVHLSDVGLIWFLSSFVYLIIPSNFEFILIKVRVLYSLSLFFIPFILFSLIYQFFFIKKYCPLCIGVISTIVIDFLLYLFYFQTTFMIPDLPSSFLLFTLIACVSYVWLSIKPYLLSYEHFFDSEIKFLNLKRNSNVFSLLLNESRIYNTGELTNPIKITNNKSSFVITKIINPYCSPCEKAFEEMIELVNENMGNLPDMQFAFLVPTIDQEDFITKTAAHFIALQAQIKSDEMIRPLSDWFAIKDYKKWSKLYPLVLKNEHFTMLKDQVEWSIRNQIEVTPFTIVNDRKLPAIYNVKDYKYIIN